MPRRRGGGSGRRACAAWLALLLAAAAGAQASPSALGRRLLIRAMPPQGTNTCRNTMQGPWFMADDRGKVCAAQQLDYGTGCCTGGQQFHCDMCNELDSCCESFEHCVSCCMAPANKADERRKEAPRAPNNKASGVWADAFEYCLAACRTHGRSTSHENAYIGPRHHCFSKLGKPMLSPPLPPGSLDGVTVLLGASGASCAAACAGKGLACSARHLTLLNSCDRLREVDDCEAGCLAEAHAPSMPAIVDEEAPKASRPALCLVGQDSPPEAFACDAAANYMRRLCACAKAEPGAGGGAASGSGGASGSAGGSAAGAADGGGGSKEADTEYEDGADGAGEQAGGGAGADAAARAGAAAGPIPWPHAAQEGARDPGGPGSLKHTIQTLESALEKKLQQQRRLGRANELLRQRDQVLSGAVLQQADLLYHLGRLLFRQQTEQIEQRGEGDAAEEQGAAVEAMLRDMDVAQLLQAADSAHAAAAAAPLSTTTRILHDFLSSPDCAARVRYIQTASLEELAGAYNSMPDAQRAARLKRSRAELCAVLDEYTSFILQLHLSQDKKILQLSCHNLETLAQEAPDPGLWTVVDEALGLRPDQEQRLHTGFVWYNTKRSELTRQMQEVVAQLQVLLTGGHAPASAQGSNATGDGRHSSGDSGSGGPGSAGPSSGGGGGAGGVLSWQQLEAVEATDALLVELGRLVWRLRESSRTLVFQFINTLDPLQLARSAVHAWPFISQPPALLEVMVKRRAAGADADADAARGAQAAPGGGGRGASPPCCAAGPPTAAGSAAAAGPAPRSSG
ncbi:hypothetical protein HT031_003664 [Scenedesmus sp. PABB004]|nr:hypothetical protein HT031_003664 [Scenedesmus sp. PABB004]